MIYRKRQVGGTLVIAQVRRHQVIKKNKISLDKHNFHKKWVSIEDDLCSCRLSNDYVYLHILIACTSISSTVNFENCFHHFKQFLVLLLMRFYQEIFGHLATVQDEYRIEESNAYRFTDTYSFK